MEELMKRIEDYDRQPEKTHIEDVSGNWEEDHESVEQPQQPTEGDDRVDLLYCIFIVAELFESLIRAYPGLEADLRHRLDELWAMIDMLKKRWTGVGLPTETATDTQQ